MANNFQLSPISQAFNDDSANRLALAQKQFLDAEGQRRVLELANLRESGDDRRLQASLAAHRDIAGMNITANAQREQIQNDAAMARTKEQIRGYMDRLTEADNLKLARSLYPLVPRENGETVEAYIERASTIAPQVVSDTILKFHDDQLDGIKKQADTLAVEEAKRVKSAADAFTDSKVDITTITNKQALAAVQQARAAGRPVEEAIQAALIKVGRDPKAATELRSLLETYRTTRAAVSEELSRTPSKDYLSGMTFLRPQLERAMTDRDRVYNTDLGRQGLLYRAKSVSVPKVERPPAPDGAGISLPSLMPAPKLFPATAPVAPMPNMFSLPQPAAPVAPAIGDFSLPVAPVSGMSRNMMVLPPPAPVEEPLPWSRVMENRYPWQTNTPSSFVIP